MTPEQEALLREAENDARWMLDSKVQAYRWIGERINLLRKELRAALQRTEKYRRAVIDMSTRGYGVRRPKWLLKTIDAARERKPESSQQYVRRVTTDTGGHEDQP